MTQEPEQPEDQADNQEVTLDQQLDALLERLEEIEPDLVPADLRKTPPGEPTPVQTTAPKPTDVSTPDPEPAAEAEPVVETVAQAQEPEPIAAEAGTSADTPDPQAAPQDINLEAQLDSLLSEMAAALPAEPVQESPPVPAQPVKAVDADVDLDSVEQLAADLIDQKIDSTIQPDQASAQPTEPEAQAQKTPEPPPVEATPAEAQATPAAFVALSEDDLSSQIDSLLNDIQQPDPGSTAPADPKKIEEPATQASPEPEPVAAAAQAPDPTADTAAVEQDGPASIEQIDSMLAESAEQAVTEPAAQASQVPSTDEILAEQAKAEEAAVVAAEANAQPAEQSPDPAAVQVPSAGASAEDVARELDADAEVAPTESAEQPEPGQAPEAAVAEPVAIDAAQDVTAVTKPGNLRKAERAMFHLCRTVNRPLKRLSPEMRKNVGYVGVLTTALGCFMLLFGMIF